MFCPKCGRETEEEGLCKACFAEKYVVFEVPQVIEVKICAKCPSYKIGDAWVDTSLQTYEELVKKATIKDGQAGARRQQGSQQAPDHRRAGVHRPADSQGPRARDRRDRRPACVDRGGRRGAGPQGDVRCLLADRRRLLRGHHPDPGAGPFPHEGRGQEVPEDRGEHHRPGREGRRQAGFHHRRVPAAGGRGRLHRLHRLRPAGVPGHHRRVRRHGHTRRRSWSAQGRQGPVPHHVRRPAARHRRRATS